MNPRIKTTFDYSTLKYITTKVSKTDDPDKVSIKGLEDLKELWYSKAEDDLRKLFEGGYVICPTCNKVVKRGILNMADHKCKTNEK